MRVVPQILSCWLCHRTNLSNPAGRYDFPHRLEAVAQAVGAADWANTGAELAALRKRLSGHP